MTPVRLAPIAFCVFGLCVRASAESLSLPAAADNTLYEDLFGTYSNGAGDYFFAGKTAGGDIRRGLIRFDLSSIPATATVNSVTLRLHMSRTRAGSQTVGVHRVLASWGEGASDAEAQEGTGIDAQPGDATWVHRFYSGTNWTTPGGDFSAVASATRTVGASVNFYTWGSSAGMVADVQGWVNGSVANNGWLVKGNEGPIQTAKRFDSRTNFEPANRPVLTVDFTRVPEPATVMTIAMLGLLTLRRR